MSSIFARLPEHILKHAFEWGHEFAWPRADALAVIEWAEKQNYTVARAEVWVPSPEGPIIPSRYVYTWSLARSQRRPGGAKSALDYVRKFEWDPNDAGFLDAEPFFNLTLDRD
jgi:hypothetical protein